MVQIHHEGRGERDLRSDLVFQRHAQGNEVTGVVAIDLPGSTAAIQIGMQNTQSGKGHEVESTVQAEMIFGDAGHADLREITDGGEEGHPAE